MKVSIECTTTELEQLAATIAYGVAYRDDLRVRTVPPRTDDTPNRDREEGV